MNFSNRFLAVGELAPGIQIVPLPATPEMQYTNQEFVANPLAELAVDRVDEFVLLLNLFKVIGDHFVQEVVAGFDLTAMNQEDAHELTRAQWYRVLYGKGVIGFVLDRLRAVPTRFWWPVQTMGNKVGDAVILPYSLTSSAGSITGGTPLPDRALVMAVDAEGNGPVYDTEYAGITLGNTFNEIGNVQALTAFGDGVSDFPDCAPVIKEIDALVRSGNRIVKRYGQPHIQVPAASVTYDDEGTASFQLDENGSVIPVQRDDKDAKYLAVPSEPRLIEYLVQTQLSILCAIAKIPPTVFNLFPLARMESGVSIEKLAQASNEKVRLWQDDLEIVIARLGLNAPRIVEEPPEEAETGGPNADLEQN